MLASCLGFKIQSFFEFRRNLSEGLELVYELIKGVDRYGDFTDLWYPKTQIQKINEGEFTLEYRHSSRKYYCHRVEDYDKMYYEILSPRNAFEICVGNTKALITERAELVKN